MYENVRFFQDWIVKKHNAHTINKLKCPSKFDIFYFFAYNMYIIILNNLNKSMGVNTLESKNSTELDEFTSELSELKNSIKKERKVSSKPSIEDIQDFLRTRNAYENNIDPESLQLEFNKLQKKTHFSLDDIKFIHQFYPEELEVYHQIDKPKIKIEKLDIDAIKYLYDCHMLCFVSKRLKEIDIDTARFLSDTTNEYFRNKSEENISLDLSWLDNIPDNILSILCAWHFNNLILWINNLTNTQTNILLKYQWKQLSFPKLAEISDYTSKKFASQRKYKISFWWIKKLSDTQFGFLQKLNKNIKDSRKKVFFIDVNQMENITKHQIENWIFDSIDARMCDIWWFALPWLKEISDDTAEALWKWSKWHISLPWLKSITDKQMHLLFDKQKSELSDSENITLDFSWLSNITREQMKILAQSWCNLKLNWLRSLTNEHIQVLKENLSQVNHSWIIMLDLSWLKEISAFQLDSLLSIPHCSIDLSNIRELTDEQLEIVIKHCNEDMYQETYDKYLESNSNTNDSNNSAKVMDGKSKYYWNGVVCIWRKDLLTKKQIKLLKKSRKEYEFKGGLLIFEKSYE